MPNAPALSGARDAHVSPSLCDAVPITSLMKEEMMQIVKLRLPVVCTVILFFACFLLHPAYASVTSFAQVSNPNGVVVDQSGNVYVQSLSILGDGGLYKFSPQGTLLGRNSNLFGKIRMVFDPAMSVIWGVETKGALYAIDPATLNAQLMVNLNNLSIPQGSVLNLLRGTYVPLIMVSPQYGDIALRRVDNDNFDLFITGQTAAGGVPFVVRLRFRPTLKPDIVVASIPWPNPIIPPPLDTQASGIAVNANGKVLTALPADVSGGTSPFYLVTFGADFPETGDALPEFVPAFSGSRVYSMGMTDSPGDRGFVFVTVAQGLGCGLGPALIWAPESLDRTTCLADLSSLGMGEMTPQEVAVGPGNVLYVTTGTRNLVLRTTLPSTPPTVVATSPVDGATGVSTNGAITAIFGGAIDPNTVTSATFKLDHGANGAVAYNSATRTATLTPSAPLIPNTTYTATLTTGVKDTSGIPLAAAKTWTFTTDSGIPTVTLIVNGGFEGGTAGWTVSSSGGHQVVVSDSSLSHTGSHFALLGGYDNETDLLYQDVAIPADATEATARFWYLIATQETTTEIAFDTLDLVVKSPSTGSTLKPLTEYSNLDKTGTSWTQSPSFDLSAFKGQTVRLQFTASTDEESLTAFIIDDVELSIVAPPPAPKVVTTSPVSGATGVAVGSAITVTFSEAVNPATISADSLSLSDGQANVSGTVSYDNATNTATFTPTTYLAYNTTYNVTVSTAVTNAAGTHLGAAASWSFTTAERQRTLSVSVMGKGSVNSNPTRIACTTGNSGNCSSLFSDGSIVTLMATASSDSIFGGWTSGCTGFSGSNCLVAMTADRSVEAFFSALPVVRVVGLGGYDNLQSAIDSAPATCTIEARAVVLQALDVTLDTGKSIIFKGGYDSGYGTNSGAYTTIDGVLTVRAGSLRVENLKIR